MKLFGEDTPDLANIGDEAVKMADQTTKLHTAASEARTAGTSYEFIRRMNVSKAVVRFYAPDNSTAELTVVNGRLEDRAVIDTLKRIVLEKRADDVRRTVEEMDKQIDSLKARQK